MRVAHIITGLTDGGAEAVLYRLCRKCHAHEHLVVSLTEEDKYGPLIRALGVPVVSLRMPPGRVRLSAIWRLRALLREQRPDVVQTWMYHADLIGGAVARWSGSKNVVWGVHHTTLDPQKSKRATIWVARACARLSHYVPQRIICCAESTARIHSELGYDSDKLVVVNNGYDLQEYGPDPDLGRSLRRSLGVPADRPLIGMVGRFDPQKDHENLLKALAILRARGDRFSCLLVGRGLDETNERLTGWIRDLRLTECVIVLGQRSDIPAIMNALDFHVLSSAYGEAFPNVLAEAMACGSPCVTTDVGDSSVIVGETGWTVPAGDAEKLADGLIAAMTAMRSGLMWELRRQDCRKRIEAYFSDEAMVTRYQEVWQSGS